MKTKIILLVLLLVGTFPIFAQSVHFYSGGQKVYLQVDSSKQIIRLKEKVALNQAIQAVGSDVLLQNPQVFRDIAESKYLIVNDFRSNKLPINNEFVEYTLPIFNLETSPIYLTGEIVLRPKSNTTIEQIVELTHHQISFVEISGYKNLLFKIKPNVNVFTVANQIYESGLVEWCHPDLIAPIEKTNDPLYPNQYYLNNTGQFGGVAGIDINAPEAWAMTTGCDNIRVAVIDDGVEEHEDLVDRVLDGFTATIPAGNGRPILDADAHGQACAGIVGATHNNLLGIRGVAPQAQIVPVNIFAVGTTANDVANAIDWAWAANGGNADIISNSWSFTAQPNQIDQLDIDVVTQAIMDARTEGRIRNGITRGCVVVSLLAIQTTPLLV